MTYIEIRQRMIDSGQLVAADRVYNRYARANAETGLKEWVWEQPIMSSEAAARTRLTMIRDGRLKPVQPKVAPRKGLVVLTPAIAEGETCH